MKQNDFYEVDGCMDFIPVKLIKEHKHITNTLEVELAETGDRTLVSSLYSFPKTHEPQKPVIPKFVVEWVEKHKEFSYSFKEWFNSTNQTLEVYSWLNPENKRQAELNALTLVTLIVNDRNSVTVEKEKLYTVKIADGILTKITRGNDVQYKMLPFGHITNILYNATYTTILTEKEIKKFDERLWQFAKEVE